MTFVDGHLTTSALPGGLPEPAIAGDRLLWPAPGAAVEMTRQAPAYRAALLDDRVLWSCEIPKGAARFSAGGRTFEGSGYAEVLTMTVAPWKLPIRELHWGRFIGARESVVWIDWRGAHPLTLVVHDGSRAETTAVDEAGLAFDGRRVVLDEPAVIRDESIGRTLREAHFLARALPRRLTDSRETKVRSRGTLSDGTGVVDRGWCIHEVVRFA